MVYAERMERHISPTDQANSNATNGKPLTEAAKCTMEQRSSSSSITSANWGSHKSPSEEDKWKYNNMVRNDREKFNSLHFC